MAYTDIDDPEAYFQVKIYTGTGSSQAQTFDGDTDMQPDMVWIKQRSGVEQHVIFDSVRGVQKYIAPNTTAAEGDTATTLTAFGSDGFTEGGHGITGGSSSTYASWNWKAGTSFTNDASATGIGTIDSSGSVNTDAGFSIISYTGNFTAGATVGHGLGVVPKMIIVKNYSNATESWNVYHESIGNTKYLALNTTAAADTAPRWNDTSPTSTVFTNGANGATNESGGTIIAYCFAEKQGYSKFGSYTGNGSTDGTFVYTGFKPAFCMVHRSSAAGENWLILDNKRDSFNPQDSSIYPNLSNAEDADGADYFDFVSNGMKVRTTNGGTNTSGATYIYMAFAENPFTTSTGVPATAR